MFFVQITWYLCSFIFWECVCNWQRAVAGCGCSSNRYWCCWHYKVLIISLLLYECIYCVETLMWYIYSCTFVSSQVNSWEPWSSPPSSLTLFTVAAAPGIFCFCFSLNSLENNTVHCNFTQSHPTGFNTETVLFLCRSTQTQILIWITAQAQSTFYRIKIENILGAICH